MGPSRSKAEAASPEAAVHRGSVETSPRWIRSAQTSAGRHTRRTTVAVMTFVGVGVILGLLAGAALTTEPADAPAEGSADAGFVRDMQAHHSQAVEMSLLVLQRTQDPAVRTLATDVLLTQQQQAGQMYGWLEQWDLPQSSPGPPMAWADALDGGMSEMGHDRAASEGTSNSMPGMADQDDMARLRESSGEQADRVYLQLMIPHHQGGVSMAQAGAQLVTDSDALHLAQTIVKAQSAELDALRQMLAARSGPQDN